MTSPNRETEAQQVETRVEQIVLTKVKASLRGKTGTIKVNLEQAGTITGQERQKMVMISKAGHQETVKEAALNQEKKEAVTSGQEQEETEITKISTAGHQGMVKEAALNQEKEIAVVSGQDQEETEMPKADRPGMVKEAAINQEKAEMAKAASDQKAQEAQAGLQASNHVRSKKALLKRCQEMKTVVM